MELIERLKEIVKDTSINTERRSARATLYDDASREIIMYINDIEDDGRCIIRVYSVNRDKSFRSKRKEKDTNILIQVGKVFKIGKMPIQEQFYRSGYTYYKNVTGHYIEVEGNITAINSHSIESMKDIINTIAEVL